MSQMSAKLTGKWKEIATRYQEGESLSQIAEDLLVSLQAVRQVLIKQGITRRRSGIPSPNVKKISKQLLEELYLEKHMTLVQVAQSIGVAKTTIHRNLKKFGIATRGSSEALKYKINTDPIYRQLITKRQGERVYIHNDRLMEELAKLRLEGFRCIPIGLLKYPKPDIIAIKEGKVFAVEVELSKIEYDKYTGITDFDDIIWIYMPKNGSRRMRKNGSF